MATYPKIHSLCTLGIRQHQRFDYFFNPFRTDFVGDSGSGKSMIADLLQLVFVGSEVYHPGTDALDKRDVDGMVLNLTPGRGVELGYIVVNIILEQGQFLSIGAYLESSGRQTKSFIIQTAYDEQRLSPLSTPIQVAQLIIADQIPTLDMLTAHLEEQGLVLHHYSGVQRKKFHAYLFRHQLLPLDLSVSHRVLSEYADILQSFSRGKTLDAGNSKSLKEFLFGTEKAKEITQKFRRAVEDLQGMMREYTQTQKDIGLVFDKSQALQELKKEKNKTERLQRIWVENLCAFCAWEEQSSLQELANLGQQYLASRAQLVIVAELIREQLDQKEVMERELQEIKDQARINYDNSSDRLTLLKPYLVLLQTHQGSVRALEEAYRQHAVDHRDQQIYQKERTHFKEHDVWHLLNRYKSSIDKATAIDKLDCELKQLGDNLNRQRTLLQFADLNQTGTLGSWAIAQDKTLSRELESILMFFQGKKVGKIAPLPMEGQYIPDPKALLSEPVISLSDENGFWLTLGGISQYIPYTPEQLFTPDRIGQLQELLAKLSVDIKLEIDRLVAKNAETEKLKKAIITSVDFEDLIHLMPEAERLDGIIINKLLLISEASLQEGLALLEERDVIQSARDHAYEALMAAQNKSSRFADLLKLLTTMYNKLGGIRIESDSSLLESLKTLGIVEDIVEADQEGAARYLRTAFQKSTDQATWLENQVTRFFSDLKSEKIKELLLQNADQVIARQAAFKMARLDLAFEPVIEEEGPFKKPIDEEKEYLVADLFYVDKFKEIARKYAPGEAYKFDEVQNYSELCADMLPEVFLTETAMGDDESMDIIEFYLSKINEKNKNLNFTKLQRLREILDEVTEEVEKRLNTVRQLNNFLNQEDREITGGHRVLLKPDFETSYSKSWIEDYADKLNNENTLFQTGQTLTELLKDSVSLDEKMLNAFYAFGGAKSAKPKIEELLDPNSYFGLTFKMETASGHTNSGSTGQTYAAIALLCLARLSLINKSAFSKNGQPGIRFMPIDEAEGLGSNFDMLYAIAKEFGFQIITMSISPLGRYLPGEQYIYILSNNKAVSEQLNFQPAGIFSEEAYLQFIES